MKIAVATNEPWGTYHLASLRTRLTERDDLRVVQVVPDLAGVPADTTVPVQVGPALPSDVDALVVTGFTRWPLRVVAANAGLPVAASCLAYLNPDPAPGPADLLAAARHRVRVVTAASPADAAAFAGHLGIDAARVRVVGNPTLDSPPTGTRVGHTLVLTSVTRADATGAAAPGNATLRAAADALAGHGHQMVVRLHPREDPAVWHRFDLDSSATARDAADGARLVVAIPGTACPEVATLGVPIAGVVDPRLQVPGHLLDLCGMRLPDAATARSWAASGARTAPAGPDTLTSAVGPVGGAADRLLDAWAAACL